MGRFHRYSWGNVGLIAYQRPTAPMLQVSILGTGSAGLLMKGRKESPIIKKETELPQTPTKAGESVVKQEKDAERRPVGFRTAFVFHLAQTHGKPLPEFAKTTGDPKQFTDKLRALVAKEASRSNTISRSRQPRRFFRRQDSSAARPATRRRILRPRSRTRA